MRLKNLEYIGALETDEEGQDLLRLHSHLLLSTLSATCDLDATHRALPWRTACALDRSQLSSLLEFMPVSYTHLTLPTKLEV